MDSDGTGLVQALGNHHVAEGAVQSGHLDHIKALVCPVDVSCGGCRRHNDAPVDPRACVHIHMYITLIDYFSQFRCLFASVFVLCASLSCFLSQHNRLPHCEDSSFLMSGIRQQLSVQA